jgi:hypothetical protein
LLPIAGRSANESGKHSFNKAQCHGRARQLPYPVTARRHLAAARAAACAELTPGAVAGEPQAAAFDVRSAPAKMRDKAVSDALAAQFGKP